MSFGTVPLRPSLQVVSVAGRPARLVEEALAVVRERRGLDFSGYRRGTIERRFVNRMMSCGITSEEDYLALLMRSEREVDDLVANLTIKVSRFYRNASVFDFLAAAVVPRLREQYPDGPLRVWSAGCARGEEAYTLAVLLAGAHVDGTDIDELALAAARQGSYPADAFDEAPEPLVAGLLHTREAGEAVFSVSADVRSRMSFRHHDVTSDNPPPGAPYHLICCRNVLIYFNRPLQARAMRLLAGALVPGGVLCLGEAEWAPDDLSSLEVVDRRRKIFRRSECEEAVS